MFTSYFAKHKNQPNGVAITYALPSWSKYRHYPPLAPTEELVKNYKAGLINEAEYTDRYFQLIKDRGITPQQVLKDLGNNAVLLCFEKPPKFCHRHLAAQWLRVGGIQIGEIM